MHRLLLALTGIFACSGALFAQQSLEQPKLIIGIVVDQMRYDYLYRYYDKYGAGGFKRLLRDGFSCENTHFNYVPTYTAPGHAAIYTGAPPSITGIISNEWYDPQWQKHRYVTRDTNETAVGATGSVGAHSPRVLLASTITDELQLFNNFRSRVAAVCLKDRGSILPAGHFPNACYWFDDESGNWITSTYYADTLPAWAQAFNAQKLPAQYLAANWNALLANGQYDESFADWERFELKFSPPGSPNTMPYDLKAANDNNKRYLKNYGALRYTPYGNTLTLEFALELIKQENFGKDNFPDFLCLSFSSTDYCGHQFGVHAEETEDVYLNLDENLERLLNFIDQNYGPENVLVFLTADHGGAETPAHLKSLHAPADVFKESVAEARIDAVLKKHFGVTDTLKYVHEAGSQQIWLDKKNLAKSRIDYQAACQVIVNFYKTLPGVYDAFTYEQALALPAEYPYISLIRRGLHPRRSGDVFFLLDPAWHSDEFFANAGTTHGSPYSYDTHVPLLWYGWKLKPGKTHRPVAITDIAPTLAAMLRIMEPNGSTGEIIEPLIQD